MVKVTKDNITRISEDALYITLADLTEDEPLYVLIEAELDRRADDERNRLKLRQHAQLNKLQEIQIIQEEMQILFMGYKGKKTLILIQSLGQEFIDDYTIDESTFTVHSKVKHEIFNNNSSWEFNSIEEARSKMARLIYNRIYDKFMREPTTDNLNILKQVLGD